MCDHYLNCEHCQDYHGELVVISDRCRRYRMAKTEMSKELKTLRQLRQDDAAFVIDMEKQVEKLQALNHHLTTKCVVQDKELRRMTETVVKLDRQCKIFQALFCRAGQDESLRSGLLKYLKDIEVDPSLFA